jgi:hypothetical protein
MIGSDFQFFTRKGAMKRLPTFPRAGGKTSVGKPVVIPVTACFSLVL